MSVTFWDRPSARDCALIGLLAASLGGCGAPPPFRINPGKEPPRYRVTCVETSRGCRKLAAEACGGEYVVLEAIANRPEQLEVTEGNVSSTGPSMGPVGWKGEFVVRCGRELEPIRLTRSDAEPTDGVPEAPALAEAAAPPPQASAPASVPAAALLCVPGSTQACLGAGACSGAQACRGDGQGYESCDCGAAVAAAPAAVPPAVASEPAPAATSQPVTPPAAPAGTAAGAGSKPPSEVSAAP